MISIVRIWHGCAAKMRDFYADLKAYQRQPNPEAVTGLEVRFDALFTQRTAFATLNQTLKRLHAHKSALLLVLQRPDIPLHTNGSENDIRGYVKWRKISGGMRAATWGDAVAIALPA